MIITVSAERMKHILVGDDTGRGGGHRHGSRDPTKSKFPQYWSDLKIEAELLHVANDPACAQPVQPNGKLRFEGVRDGIRIRVVVEPTTGGVITAHPVY